VNVVASGFVSLLFVESLFENLTRVFQRLSRVRSSPQPCLGMHGTSGLSSIQNLLEPLSPPDSGSRLFGDGQHRLGRHEDARRSLAQSRDDQNWGQVPPHLIREAEALIEGKVDESNRQV
jgi:hypothetical protein